MDVHFHVPAWALWVAGIGVPAAVPVLLVGVWRFVRAAVVDAIASALGW
jgi:hypothetical protein